MILTVRPKFIKKYSKNKERITLQFRKYDKDGQYIPEDEKGTETIHFKDCTLKEAFEIIKSAVTNSRLISENIEVD